MMKKILFGAAIALSLTLAGCIEKNDSYEKYEKVAGGVTIYNAAQTQNTVALQQANFGVRLAMLLAEAAKQPEVEKLEDLKVNNVKIQQRMFGSAKIEKLDNGDYKVTFTPNIAELDAYARKGTLLVRTNGTQQLSETSEEARWELSFESGLDMVYSGSQPHTITVSGGTTSIYYSAGYYMIEMNGIRSYYDTSKSVVSNWTGSFTLKPENIDLAFSDCAGKKFLFSGDASGDTFMSFDRQLSIPMSFYLTDGEYYSASAIRNGEFVVRMYGTFDPVSYPSDTVTVNWIEGQSYVHYNGFVAP